MDTFRYGIRPNNFGRKWPNIRPIAVELAEYPEYQKLREKGQKMPEFHQYWLKKWGKILFLREILTTFFQF